MKNFVHEGPRTCTLFGSAGGGRLHSLHRALFGRHAAGTYRQEGFGNGFGLRGDGVMGNDRGVIMGVEGKRHRVKGCRGSFGCSFIVRFRAWVYASLSVSCSVSQIATLHEPKRLCFMGSVLDPVSCAWILCRPGSWKTVRKLHRSRLCSPKP